MFNKTALFAATALMLLGLNTDYVQAKPGSGHGASVSGSASMSNQGLGAKTDADVNANVNVNQPRVVKTRLNHTPRGWSHGKAWWKCTNGRTTSSTNCKPPGQNR
jgi:hypothetical protein